MTFWRSWRLRIFLVLAVLGPGFITANVDNDAGGIYTYSQAGAAYGYTLLWTMIPITLALIVVQEMCARMGAVTGKGLSDLIREEFGLRMTFVMMLLLVVVNFGNVIAETKDGQHRFQIAVVRGDFDPAQFRVEFYADPTGESGAKPEILAACNSSAEPSGTIVYSACCSAKRPATDYTARLIPSHVGASVPLEAGQILWQR